MPNRRWLSCLTLVAGCATPRPDPQPAGTLVIPLDFVEAHESDEFGLVGPNPKRMKLAITLLGPGPRADHLACDWTWSEFSSSAELCARIQEYCKADLPFELSARGMSATGRTTIFGQFSFRPVDRPTHVLMTTHHDERLELHTLGTIDWSEEDAKIEWHAFPHRAR